MESWYVARDMQLWGVDDVAAALNVDAELVRRWQEQGERLRGGSMPAPVMTVNLGRTPLWRAADVVAWAVKTGMTRNLWPTKELGPERRVRPAMTR
jgi:hypothetical protein